VLALGGATVLGVSELCDISRSQIRAISGILERLEELGALSNDQELSRLLRFALTDAFNAGARIASGAMVAQLAPDAPHIRLDVRITTLHNDLPSLLQEEVERRARAG
jgi:hypothetical protein